MLPTAVYTGTGQDVTVTQNWLSGRRSWTSVLAPPYPGSTRTWPRYCAAPCPTFHICNVQDAQAKRQKEIRDLMKKRREKAVLVDRCKALLYSQCFTVQITEFPGGCSPQVSFCSTSCTGRCSVTTTSGDSAFLTKSVFSTTNSSAVQDGPVQRFGFLFAADHLLFWFWFESIAGEINN